MKCGVKPKRSALAHGFRQHPEHRENQRLSFKIIVLGVACDAADLFPHLRQSCKAGKTCICLAWVRPQLLGHPAFETVDEGRENRTIVAAECVAERVEFARIHPWQCCEQRRGALLKLERVSA